jgi:hypothetical protein
VVVSFSFAAGVPTQNEGRDLRRSCQTAGDTVPHLDVLPGPCLLALHLVGQEKTQPVDLPLA